jgi:hypothetical protein
MQTDQLRAVVATLAGCALAASACTVSSIQSATPEPVSEVLPSQVYPPPAPTLATGGAILAGCPHSAGVDQLAAVTVSDVTTLLQQLTSEDPATARRAADPGFWPALATPILPAGQPDEPRLLGLPEPASASPYAGALAHQCGRPLVDVSWTFTVCPGPCDEQGSASLNEDFFLLSRYGTLLIWAMWP